MILQQTRVAQAAPYFVRFLERFPTVRDLARAREEEVLKVWEGAGYYARARRLHEAARRLVDRWNARLPERVEDLEELPGVGPYIARAVASIAYGVPVLALDANGRRVAARLLADGTDPWTSAGHARLAEFLDGERPARSSGEFNEAVMELGETVCLPRRPRCGVCPLSDVCRGRWLDDPGSIPARRPRTRPHVVAAILAVAHHGRWLLQRRPPNGLLGGLWELPGGKVRSHETPRAAAARESREELGWVPRHLRKIGTVHHGYSHFTVDLHLFAAFPTKRPSSGRWHGTPRRWVTLPELEKLPIPRATRKMVPLLAAQQGRASRGS